MSILLNGTTQRIWRHATVPDDILFTVMGWVYVPAWGTDQTIFGLGALVGTNHYVAQLDAVSGNKIKFWNGTADTLGSTILSTGTWYHIALVGNGTGAGALKLYLDAVLEASGASGTAFVPDTLYIGGTETPSGTWNEHANLQIAQYRLYDAALAAAEILTERASVNAVRTAGLNIDTPMNAGTLANCLLDSSGNGHFLTADNTPSLAGDPPPVGASTPPMFRGV